jgi:DNA-binding transcriptional MerR regulator
MKIDPLTLELLLIGGWLKDTGVELSEIEEYIAKRKEGDTELYPPSYQLELPRGLGNLLMAALAAACSSEHMPPVTSDYDGFKESINELLGQSGAPEKQQLNIVYTSNENENEIESFLPKLAESIRSEDLRCLFATIPRLGYDSPNALSPKMLKNLIEARSKDEVLERQKSFREVVDNYLTQLQDADESERQIILEEFKQKATRDLNLLQKELKRLAIGTLILKEGLVGMAAGTAAGLIPILSQPVTAAIGSILGLSRGLLKYRQERGKIFSTHWSSWAVSAENRRFSLW